MTYGPRCARSVRLDRASYDPAALPVFVLLIVFFGDERLCFARIFKEPMIVRHSCEKPVKFYLNNADFNEHKIQFVRV